MIADVICHGCTQWPGGSLDKDSTAEPWIGAIGPGMAVTSDEENANIQQHSDYGT